MKYWIERLYPYVFAIISTIVLQKVKECIMCNDNFNDMIGNLVTLDSIVIGFFGAIMPVILSMKNESKFVKYVFENDTEGLFAKYLKITIFSGLCSAICSLSLYVRDSFTHAFVKNINYALWIFFTALFLVSTYRSLSYMISLVFSKDNISSDEKKNENRKKKEIEIAMEEKYK